MAHPTFTQFSEALCTAAGVQAPDLTTGEEGLLAFHLILRDVTIDLLHLQDQPVPEFMVLVTFGEIPEASERQVLRMMAEANFSLLGSGVPVYGCNPDSGQMVLRLSVPLHEADPVQTFRLLQRLTELVLQWRADPTLDTLSTAAAVPDPSLFA